jgi:hypothetical protein
MALVERHGAFINTRFTRFRGSVQINGLADIFFGNNAFDWLVNIYEPIYEWASGISGNLDMLSPWQVKLVAQILGMPETTDITFRCDGDTLKMTVFVNNISTELVYNYMKLFNATTSNIDTSRFEFFVLGDKSREEYIPAKLHIIKDRG